MRLTLSNKDISVSSSIMSYTKFECLIYYAEDVEAYSKTERYFLGCLMVTEYSM